MATKKTIKKKETKQSAPKASSKSTVKTSVKVAEKPVAKTTKKPVRKAAEKPTTLKSTANIAKVEPEKQEKPQKTTSTQQVKIRRPYVILIIVITVYCKSNCLSHFFLCNNYRKCIGIINLCSVNFGNHVPLLYPRFVRRRILLNILDIRTLR